MVRKKTKRLQEAGYLITSSTAPTRVQPPKAYKPPRRFKESAVPIPETNLSDTLPILGGNPALASTSTVADSTTNVEHESGSSNPSTSAQLSTPIQVDELSEDRSSDGGTTIRPGSLEVSSNEDDSDGTACQWSTYGDDPLLVRGDFGGDQGATYDGITYQASTDGMSSVYKARHLSYILERSSMKAEDLIDTSIIPKTPSGEPECELEWGMLLLRELAQLVEFRYPVHKINFELKKAIRARRDAKKTKKDYITHVSVHEVVEYFRARSIVREEYE